MPRYIDYDRLFDAMVQLYKFSEGKERKAFSAVLDLISMQPFADVQEVRHGKWVLYKPRRENRNATYKCSECEKACSSYYNDVGGWNYCPHCGAKMDGGDGG